MKKSVCALLFLFLFSFTTVLCQTNGNIPLLSKNKFNRYWGSGDVWGVQINGINYALVTLDGGLSIVNTNNTSNPVEVRHINRTGYIKTNGLSPRLWVGDVETFLIMALHMPIWLQIVTTTTPLHTLW